MTRKSPTPTAKRAKARVMYLYTNGETGVPGPSYSVSIFPTNYSPPAKPDIPGVFTPCLSRKEAEEKRKWANLPEDEKAERMAIAFYEHSAGKGAWIKTNAHLRTSVRLGMFAVLKLQGERP